MKLDLLIERIAGIDVEWSNNYYFLFTDNKEIAQYPDIYNLSEYLEHNMIVFDVSYMSIEDKTIALYFLLLKIKDLCKCTLLNACRYRGSVYKEVYENGVRKKVYYFGKIDDYGVKEKIQYDIAAFEVMERS